MEADLTESEPAGVEAEATDGAIRATSANAETIFFILNPIRYFC
jgi:hypothetical protein